MLLADELKEHTADIHRASEKEMIMALKRISTMEDYVRMLNWLYGFYGPMEEAIRTWLTEDALPDMQKRCRAENLLYDIKESGVPIPQPDICTELPYISSIHSAIGALYVVEGSTLGGR